MAASTSIDPKVLQDYVATANSGKYKSFEEINTKFPELKGYDTEVLKDYVATANSGKYKSWEEINSKFPEFTSKKKVPTETTPTGVESSGGSEPTQPTAGSEGFQWAGGATADNLDRGRKESVTVGGKEFQTEPSKPLTSTEVVNKANQLFKNASPVSPKQPVITDELKHLSPKVVAGHEDMLNQYISNLPQDEQDRLRKKKISEEESLSMVRAAVAPHMEQAAYDMQILRDRGVDKVMDEIQYRSKELETSQFYLEQDKRNLQLLQEKFLSQKGYKALSEEYKTVNTSIKDSQKIIQPIIEQQKNIEAQLMQFEPLIQNGSFVGSQDQYKQYEELATKFNEINNSQELQSYNNLISRQNEIAQSINSMVTPEFKKAEEELIGKINENIQLYNGNVEALGKLRTPENIQNIEMYQDARNRFLMLRDGIAEVENKMPDLKYKEAMINNLNYWSENIPGLKVYDLGAKTWNSLSGAVGSLLGSTANVAAGLSEGYTLSDKVAESVTNLFSPKLMTTQTEVAGKQSKLYKKFYDSETDKINWSSLPDELANQAGPFIVLAATGSVGRMVGLSDATAIVLPGMMLSYQDALETGQELYGDDRTGATIYALGSSFITGITELIMPDRDIISGKLKQEISQAFVKNYLTKGVKFARQEAIKTLLVNGGKEVSEEFADRWKDVLLRGIVNVSGGDVSYDIPTIQEQLSIAASTFALTGIGGAKGAMNETSNTKKLAIYNAAQNFPESMKVLDELEANGIDISEQREEVTKMYTTLKGVPNDLSIAKKIAVAEKLEKVNEIQEINDSGINPVMVKIGEKKIGEIESQIEEVVSDPEFDSKFEAETNEQIAQEEATAPTETGGMSAETGAKKPVPGEKETISDIEITYPTNEEAASRREERNKEEYVIAASEGLIEENPEQMTEELNGTFGVLTAENPMAQPLTEQENSALNKKAEEWLKKKGYKPRKVVGKYGQAENSFFVPNLTKEHAIEFANEFKQESVAHSEGLISQDGSMNERVSEEDNLSLNEFKPGDDFVTVVKTKDGLKTFSIGYSEQKTESNAVQESATEKMDVRQQAEDGEALGKGDTQKQEATTQGEPTEEVTTPAKPVSKEGELTVDEAIKSIRAALKATNIEVVDDQEAFEKAVKENKGQKASEGLFVGDDGKIYLNRSKLSNEWGRTIVFHEGTHPIINIIRNTNKPLYDSIIKGMREAAQTNKGIADVIKWAEKEYGDKGKGVVEDEIITETIARVASGVIKLNEIPTTLKQKIVSLINDIAKMLGLGQISNTSSEADFVKLANQIADALTQGKDVSGIVGEENVREYQSPFITKIQDRLSVNAEEFEAKTASIAKEIESRVVPNKTTDGWIKTSKQKDKIVEVFKGEATLENIRNQSRKSYTNRAFSIARYPLSGIDILSNFMAVYNQQKEGSKKAALREAKLIINHVLGYKKLQPNKKDEADVANKKKETIIKLKEAKRAESMSEMYDIIGLIPNQSIGDDLIYKIYNARTFSDKGVYQLKKKDDILSEADSIYDNLKNKVKDNLKAIYDSIDPAIRNLTKLWYDGANIIAQEFSKEYGITTIQSAAIIASQSPQMPWFSNLHLAQALMDILATKNNEAFTQEQVDYFIASTKDYKDQKKYIPHVKTLVGTKLSDLSDYDAGIFVRSYYDLNMSRKAPKRLPSGVIVGYETGDSSFSSYPTIEKGVTIFRNNNWDIIQKSLGDANKVRNFFNNISNPTDADAITNDTHAMAAALLLPLASADAQVKFDPATYAFYSDSYRELASELGLLTRELQSITWEGVRAIFPKIDKTSALKNKIEGIWKKYAVGAISLETARNQILEKYGKDANKTEWSDHLQEWLDGKSSTEYIRPISAKGNDRSELRSTEGKGTDGRISSVGGRDSRIDGDRLTQTQESRGNRGDLLSDTYYEPHLTESADGNNYVFFHVSSADKKSIARGINSTKQYSTRTSREEKGLQYGVASFYTKNEDGERMVGGDKYVVEVPKDKVYPMDTDPNGYRKRAEEKISSKTPFRKAKLDKAVSEMAAKDGYQMIVAEWNYSRAGKNTSLPALRADATVTLKPSNKSAESFKSNIDKGMAEIPHPDKQSLIRNEAIQKIATELVPYLEGKNKRDTKAYEIAEEVDLYGGIIENYKEPNEYVRGLSKQEFSTMTKDAPKKLSKQISSVQWSAGNRGEISPKDQIARGVEGIVSKIGGIKNLTEGEKTKLVNDLIDVFEGLSRQAGVTLKDAIDKFISLIKKSGLNLSEIDIRDIKLKLIEFVENKLRYAEGINIKSSEIASAKREAVGLPPLKGETKIRERAISKRAAKGTNEAIKEAIEAIGLNYEVENVAAHKEYAEQYMERLGDDAAVDAVRSGLIDGSVAAWIMALAIDNLKTQINTTTNAAKKVELKQKQASYFDFFSTKATKGGQYNASLSRIYEDTDGFYQIDAILKRAIEANGNEDIPVDVKAKLISLSEQLDKVRAEFDINQEKLKKAEEEANFQRLRADALEKTKPADIKRKGKQLADKIRKLKNKPFPGLVDENGNPIDVFTLGMTWNDIIDEVAKFVENVSDVIQGIQDYLKEKEWYNKLTDKGKASVERQLIDFFIPQSEKPMPILTNTGEVDVPYSVIKQLVQEGADTLDALVDEVHKLLDGKATKRQIRDAISGYGKQRFPSKDPLKQKIAQLKREGQLVSALEDVRKGMFPLKSGYQREKPSDENRALLRQIKEEMKNLPEEAADVERKFASVQQRIKTSLENRIADIEKQIEAGEREKKSKKPTQYNEENKLLKEQLEKLKEKLDEVAGKDELTHEEKVARALASIERITEALELQIAEGDLAYGKGKPKVQDPALDAARERLAELRKTRDEMRIASGEAERHRLDLYKNRLARDIAQLEDKLRTGDFTKKEPKPPVELDREGKRLAVERLRLKDEMDVEIERIRLKNRPDWEKALDTANDIVGIPKGLLASGDLSAAGRQGLILSLLHPQIAGKAFIEQLRFLFSKKYFDAYNRALRSNPAYKDMIDAGLYLSFSTSQLAAKEEQLMNRILEKFPLAAASGRAYTGYLNMIRSQVFLQFKDTIEADGIKGTEAKKELKEMANWINIATGRGKLWGSANMSIPFLNNVFFAPKFVASRIQIILYTASGGMMVKTPKARAEFRKAMATYIGFGLTVLALAALAGADVDDDPTSTDFGKIRIGDRRIDIWGGTQQWVVLMMRLFRGRYTSAATGEQTPLNAGGYNEKTYLTVIGDFASSKVSPPTGAALEHLQGKYKYDKKLLGYTLAERGDKPDIVSTALGNITPIVWNEALDTDEQDNLAEIIGYPALNALGFSVQKYPVPLKSQAQIDAQVLIDVYDGNEKKAKEEFDKYYVPDYESKYEDDYKKADVKKGFDKAVDLYKLQSEDDWVKDLYYAGSNERKFEVLMNNMDGDIPEIKKELNRLEGLGLITTGFNNYAKDNL